MTIDPAASGAVLKRERVRQAILELLETRRPGDAIPSERALCADLGVSRPTLRAAVDELVREGLLVREHGRGMFVAPEKIVQELAPEQGAFSLPRAAGVWSSRLLEFTVVPAGARVGRRLRMSPAGRVRYVVRLRLVDGVPMALEYLHLPLERVPGLTAAELERGRLHEQLRTRHGVHVREAVQSIEPTVATPEESRLLEVPELSPALLFERLTTDTDDRPVEYVHALYRGDRYRIVSRLSLEPPQGSPSDAPPPPVSSPVEHHPGIPPGDLSAGAPVAYSARGEVQNRQGRLRG
ncbi:GntR family transcriptional regulator [Streptomyces sp. XM4193]|uniref:GntR family transcriptional regulator n=1 Tax=Streptomyces sp. XM4193 TaxID=2929782 RepID=UPI001FF99A4E|nr:GntR family transcriptional regulator [Streptomyces sp. XM4193]MCK1795775.1 GntR family transcriptional regulator [Streptomyces sp. XM4193]